MIDKSAHRFVDDGRINGRAFEHLCGISGHLRARDPHELFRDEGVGGLF